MLVVELVVIGEVGFCALEQNLLSYGDQDAYFYATQGGGIF
jgi:hypothetical protein